MTQAERKAFQALITKLRRWAEGAEESGDPGMADAYRSATTEIERSSRREEAMTNPRDRRFIVGV